MTPLNRFVALSLIFQQEGSCTANLIRPPFSCHTEAKKGGTTIHTTDQLFENNPIVISKSTGRIRIFSDRLLIYDTLDVTVGFDGLSSQLSRVSVQSTTGVPDHTLFQIYFRLVFAFFCLLFLAFLTMRLRLMPPKLWHLEQKLTVPLLFLDLLFTDPLYILHAYRPSRFLIVFHTIMTSLFTSYFRFFVLVLFDSLRYKNRKTDHCFFSPKIAFSLVHFAVSLIHGISDDVASFGDSPLERNHTQGTPERAEMIIYCTYLIWVAWSVVAASAQVDITERYKFNMYLAASAFSLLALGTVQIIFHWMRLFGRSSLHFAISFAAQNVFVLLMAYCHWPYEMLQDQTYLDSSPERPPAEFLRN
jgi:hypothetical protein